MRKKFDDTVVEKTVIQDAGLFAGVGESPSGSCAVTTVEFFSVPLESERQIESKLSVLDDEPGTRYATVEDARSHLANLIRG